MYALREALAAFRRAPLLTFLSAAMIALSLFVIGLFGLAAHNVRLTIRDVEARVQVVAYLRDDAPYASVQEARRDIGTYAEVSEIRYISRAEALQIARRELTELSNIIGTLETNPLPASLEISLKPEQTGSNAVRSVARRVESMPIVEQVMYGEDWVDRIFLLRRAAGAATVTLGIGFAVVAALIIGAAIRMAVFARRDEIRIMRLVGATDAFIRRPFVLEGFFTGFIGAVIALLATWGVFRLLSDTIVKLVWLPTEWLGAGLAGGATVGLLASMIAVRRHLREIV